MSAAVAQLPVLMTKADIAHHMRVSRNHVDTLERNGRFLPSIKVCGSKRWRSSDFLAWIEAGCPKPESSEVA